jgi:multidrug efflux pump subunit AcrB
LAAQFESCIDPFIIILTVPMAAAGAFILPCGYLTKRGNIFTKWFNVD